jgi:putative oxidoreductase
MDAALLIARLIVGLALAAHGMQKLLGWFGGYGLKGTGGFFESLGFRPGVLFALAAGLGEVGGGLLTAAGLLGPIGPGLIITVMVVAIVGVHLHNGFFAQANGYELPLMYAVVGLVLAIAGPGTYSLDALLGFSLLSGPTLSWIVTGCAVAVGLANVAVRRPNTHEHEQDSAITST